MKTSNSILNAQLLKSIEEYTSETDLLFKLKGFPEKVTINYFTIPDSFDDADSKRRLKKAKLSSFYELLNLFYKKLDINEIDLKTLQDGDQFGFLHIVYYIKPSAEAAQFFRHENHNLFIMSTGDPDIFRMSFKKGFCFDYIEYIIDSEYIDIEKPIKQEHQQVLLDLENIVFGACQKANIEIPKEIDISKFENLIIKIPDSESFVDFLTLTTRNEYNLKSYKSDAKRLQKLFEKGYDEYKYADKVIKILEEYYMTNDDDVFLFNSFFKSDWKFDPDDAIGFVESILGKEFTFDYPDETFAHDLFSYLQTALAKQDLELMSVDCHGDNYLFFIANKSDVATILELSQIINLKVDKLS